MACADWCVCLVAPLSSGITRAPVLTAPRSGSLRRHSVSGTVLSPYPPINHAFLHTFFFFSSAMEHVFFLLLPFFIRCGVGRSSIYFFSLNLCCILVVACGGNVGFVLVVFAAVSSCATRIVAGDVPDSGGGAHVNSCTVISHQRTKSCPVSDSSSSLPLIVEPHRVLSQSHVGTLHPADGDRRGNGGGLRRPMAGKCTYWGRFLVFCLQKLNQPI